MIKVENTTLLIVDVQDSLIKVMEQRNQLIRNLKRLIHGAHILDLAILWTEQAPDKIGKTTKALTPLLKKSKPIRKRSFSCCGCAQFLIELKKKKRTNIILCGIESHVCIYQTAVDLLKHKYHVEVVADAISSRDSFNTCIALERMKQEGVKLTTTEMVLCELLKTTQRRKFKSMLDVIK